MSQLLREYDDLIINLLAAARQDSAYVVARWHRHDNYSAIWRNHKLDETVVSQNAGVGIYVFTLDGHVSFGSTNDLSQEGISSLYSGLLAAAQTNQQLGIAQAKQIFELAQQPNLGEDATHYQHKSLLDYELSEFPRLMQRLETDISTVDPEASINIYTDISQDLWRIVRSDGTDVDFSIPKVCLRMCSVTVRDESGTAQAYLRAASTSVAGLNEQINSSLPGFLESIPTLRQQISAPSVNPGSPALLLDAELVGMIAHEALGHPAESDIIASGGSVLGDEKTIYKSGQTIASKGINVTDHESELQHGFHPYGAFGNARLPVEIVKDGKLHESISDIFSSHQIGVPNKNCERSEGYWAPAIPRMSNTYVHVDNQKPLAKTTGLDAVSAAQATLASAGIFEKYPSVLFIRNMRGGQVNPASGTFMFGTAYTYELTADRIVQHKPASLSGDVLSALKSIAFAAGDIDTEDFGFCGKASQTACVRSGGNAFVFLEPNENLTVA